MIQNMFMPNVTCQICKKEFYIKPSHQLLGYGKFCSRHCHHLGMRKGKYVSCSVCGIQTWKTPKALNGSKSKNYFCSKHCQAIWRNTYYSGPRHPNWVNGKCRDYRKIIKNSDREARCLVCGCGDKRVLVVHHKDKKRENNKLENLEWLCLNCHHLVHKHRVKI